MKTLVNGVGRNSSTGQLAQNESIVFIVFLYLIYSNLMRRIYWDNNNVAAPVTVVHQIMLCSVIIFPVLTILTGKNSVLFNSVQE